MDFPLLSKEEKGKWENEVSGDSRGEELTEDIQQEASSRAS